MAQFDGISADILIEETPEPAPSTYQIDKPLPGTVTNNYGPQVDSKHGPKRVNPILSEGGASEPEMDPIARPKTYHITPPEPKFELVPKPGSGTETETKPIEIVSSCEYTS